MKIFKISFLLFILALPSLAKIRSGEELITAMHDKYDGKWYKTLTFQQQTINYLADGTSNSTMWYEAMSVPGRLRIDIAPVENKGGMLFSDGKLFSFRDGKQTAERPLMHPLLLLGFDVYAQPVKKTLEQLASLNIKMSILRTGKWQGKAVYIVGANPGDLTSPQFWIDKKELLFVRLLVPGGRDKKSTNETQFNKYVKMKGGGWVAAEVQFIVNGKLSTSEVYSDIRTGIELNEDLWNPAKWASVERKHFVVK